MVDRTDGPEAVSATAEVTVKACAAGDPAEPTNPCELENIRQLQHLMLEHLDGHFRLGNDIDATETKDWPGGAGFMPIGRPPAGHNIGTSWPEDTVFRGTLDGA